MSQRSASAPNSSVGDATEAALRRLAGLVNVLRDLPWGRTAILFALADHYPEAGFLAPVGTRDRDLAYQWSFTAMTELETAAIGYLRREDDESRELYRSAAASFSGALEGREFLVGDSLTVADIVTTGVLFVSKRAKLLTEESPPPLQAYFARLSTRGALARAAQRVESVLQPA